jgi:hypothetical protein
MMVSHLHKMAREGMPCLLLFDRMVTAVWYKGFLQVSTSHRVTTVTTLSSVRLIAGDAKGVIFDGNDDVVVVGGVLEAVRDGEEQRRYHRTVDEVRGGGTDAKF